MKKAIEHLWKWLTNPTWNKALVGVAAIATIISTIYFMSSGSINSEHYTSIIVKKGGVIYTGITEEKYEKALLRWERKLVGKINSIKEEEHKKRQRLVEELMQVRSKLANLEPSYREMQHTLKSAEKFLLKYTERTGDVTLMAARNALNKGEIDKAINMIMDIHKKHKAVAEEAQLQLTALAELEILDENFEIVLNEIKSKQGKGADRGANETIMRDSLPCEDINKNAEPPQTIIFGPKNHYIFFYSMKNKGAILNEVKLKDIANDLEWNVDLIEVDGIWWEMYISESPLMEENIIVDAKLPSGEKCQTRTKKLMYNNSTKESNGGISKKCAVELLIYSESVLGSSGKRGYHRSIIW